MEFGTGARIVSRGGTVGIVVILSPFYSVAV